MRTQHGTPIPSNPFGMPDSLFSVPPVVDGATFEPEKDGKRLAGQLAAVCRYLETHEWVTLRELADAAHGSEAGVSARLRDLRKPEGGAHRIDRRRREGGLWEYRHACQHACNLLNERVD